MKHTALIILFPILFMTSPVHSQDTESSAVTRQGSKTESGLLLSWEFSPDHLQSERFSAQVGSYQPEFSSRPLFSKTQPHAARFLGDAKIRQRIVVEPALKPGELPADALTVETWAQVGKPLEWGGLVGCLQDNGSFEHGWLLGYRHSQFCFAVSTKSQKRLTYLTARRQFEPNFWYHIVGVWDGKTQSLYVDGKLAAESKTKSQTGPISYPPAAPFVIGAYEDKDEFHPLQGLVANVSLWDRALTAAEVEKRFDQSKTKFPDAIPVRPDVADWPTWNRDNQRTGISTEPADVPLRLQWTYQQKQPPRPAWPRPANQDFWHKKFNLQARVIYDRAAHVVSVGNRIFFGSSADDKVYCLNATTGATEWEFYTSGPVRLAPTVHQNRVLFGSDDGHVYCVSVDSGKLIWKHRAGPSERYLPGNERVISAWPVRTGVLVEDNIAYFCAGLFPKQGVYQIALDAASGKLLASGKVDASAQGYLERRAGRMFVPTGRDPAGAFVQQLKRRGKGIGREVSGIPEKYRYAFIGAGNVRFGGGENEVAAFDVKNGQQLWTAPVSGKAWSLAWSRGRLLVSTDTGAVYCFSAEKKSGSPNTITPQKNVRPISSVAMQRARNALLSKLVPQPPADAEFKDQIKGYCLVSDGADSEFLSALAQQSELQIVALVDQQNDSRRKAKAEEKIHELRSQLDQMGLAGRVTIHAMLNKKRLPYTDYMFNLVITNQSPGTPAAAELKRVLRPYGGRLVRFQNADARQPVDTFVRSKLKGAGQWGHMYANAGNTVCSEDLMVGGEMQLQWFGRPGPMQMLDRHHRTIAPVWANGRLFIPGNNRVIGADAYNGTQLWNVEIPDSRRMGAYRDSSYLVASGDSVFVAAGSQCHVYNAQTGQLRRTLKTPPALDEKPREWGFLSVVGDQVFGTTTRAGGIRRDYGLNAINEGTFWDFRPLVCSDSLFVRSPKTGRELWSYPATDGMLINSTFTVGPKNVYFVESSNPKTKDVANGRVAPQDLVSQGSRLVALDRESGSISWSVDAELSNIQHNVFCATANGLVVVVGSYNSGKDKKTDSVMYDVRVMKAASGELVWKHSQKQNLKIGGDHGEQDHHPVIVGKTLYCEPFAYELETGREIEDWAWSKKHRRGCGTVSASANSFFFRQSNPTMFDLRTNTYDKVTTSTRPGCWINMIPAGGLLLIPEASSGCTCNYAIQTSLAFLPRERLTDKD